MSCSMQSQCGHCRPFLLAINRMWSHSRLDSYCEGCSLPSSPTRHTPASVICHRRLDTSPSRLVWSLLRTWSLFKPFSLTFVMTITKAYYSFMSFRTCNVFDFSFSPLRALSVSFVKCSIALSLTPMRTLSLPCFLDVACACFQLLNFHRGWENASF